MILSVDNPDDNKNSTYYSATWVISVSFDGDLNWVNTIETPFPMRSLYQFQLNASHILLFFLSSPDIDFFEATFDEHVLNITKASPSFYSIINLKYGDFQEFCNLQIFHESFHVDLYNPERKVFSGVAMTLPAEAPGIWENHSISILENKVTNHEDGSTWNYLCY